MFDTLFIAQYRAKGTVRSYLKEKQNDKFLDECVFAPQGQDLPSLVSKVVDELAVLSILPSQHLLQLKHWRVNRFCPMPLERRHNFVEDLIKHN